MSAIPVIILNGFLGAGKTTLLRNLIVQSHEQQRSIAVIVNDMSELEVDSVLVANTDIVGQEQHNFIAITGDNISSKQGLDKLDSALVTLSESCQPDLVIIETSGSSHPLPLVEYFRAQSNFDLTGVLVLADAQKLAHDYQNGQTLLNTLQANLKGGKRDVTNLLIEQLMFSTQVLLSKTENLTAQTVQSLASALHAFNPYVAISTLPYGNLSLEPLLSLPKYDFFRVEALISELGREVKAEANSSSVYQLASVVIEDDRPFHPQRLWDTYHQLLSDGIHRSKGFFWLASRDQMALLWNQAAGSIGLEYVGYWRSGVLEQPDNGLTPAELTMLEQVIENQSGRFGDRRCRLTIIGDKAQLADFTRAVKACFLTEEEISSWQNGVEFSDPWPTTVVKHKG